MAALLAGEKICGASFSMPWDKEQLNAVLETLRAEGYLVVEEPCVVPGCRNITYRVPAARLARVLGGEE